MKQNAKYTKLNIPMYLACILFCLTLISAYMTSGLYAKYTARASGENGARVIRFGDITLTESGDFQPDGSMMIVPGVDLTKKAVIDFAGSEASAYVFVKISLSSDWTTTDNRNFAVTAKDKTQMQWSIANEWLFLKSDNGESYIYYQELAPNTPLSADIIADNGRISVSDHITRRDIAGMGDISISFCASAVQSNGFESPEAAWASIAIKEV